MNSTYGALLNKAFRYNRRELGASTTGTGREITIFMAELIGETLSGEHTEVMKYQTVGSKNKMGNHYCCTNDFIIYGDTDSVAGDTIVDTDVFGKTTIAELFDKLPNKYHVSGKEYAYKADLFSPCVDDFNVVMKQVRAVYRHKVSKSKWRLTASTGVVVDMTEDHSAMVIRDGSLIELKPINIRQSDKLMVLTSFGSEIIDVSSIECIGEFEDEYVYDIIMMDDSTPYFFANGVLVHNSNYFRMPVDNEADAVEVADLMAQTVNEAFPEFMRRFFYCTEDRSKLISAAREVVAVRGLFLNAKKKYTLRVVDKEGKKTDELKYMGSELKKADTPKKIQNFLKGLMDLVLTDEELSELEFSKRLDEYVNSNRKGLIYSTDDVIGFGVSKQINNLEQYQREWYEKENGNGGKAKLPGHVRAAVNYNFLLDEFGDDVNKPLRSGDKGMIFYLKPNDYGFKTLAIPADSAKMPPWFDDNFKIDLPTTEEKMIDLKLEGIFEALRLPVPTPKLAHVKASFVF